MRIMTVRALHETFVYSMLGGHRKLRTHIGVATVAKIGLRLGQQLLRGRCFMDGVTTRADDIGGCVRTAANVCPTNLLGVAIQTRIEHLLGLQHRKRDDLRLISLSLSMCFSRAVATLAAFLFKLDPVINQCLRVRVSIKVCIDSGVAGPAHRASRVACRKGAGLLLRRFLRRRLILALQRKNRPKEQRHQTRDSSQRDPHLSQLYGRGRRFGIVLHTALLLSGHLFLAPGDPLVQESIQPWERLS